MAKTLSPDLSPSQAIGKGIYDYRVTVGTGPREVIVHGAKNAGAINISW